MPRYLRHYLLFGCWLANLNDSCSSPTICLFQTWRLETSRGVGDWYSSSVKLAHLCNGKRGLERLKIAASAQSIGVLYL
ncbi:hypothetical protein QBC45DRAFT_410709 [Copromyces sp. CBS 386.78]|nr:hypothetical protein QBC45DRAFT_410709 [Copromyces sp. CBS 386.78]